MFAKISHPVVFAWQGPGLAYFSNFRGSMAYPGN
jgi:hypothetical protein